MPNQEFDTLATISIEGEVPETRMKNAMAVQDYCRRLIQNDDKRSWKRARVNGLVDGNPPYKASKLREAGRAEACNVNWNVARSYMESAVGAFYDLFTEAPGYLTVLTDFGSPEQKEQWSSIISEEADRIFRQDTVWDYNMQVSQWDMVLHGCGPFLFEDAHQVLPKAFLCGDLKVPEFAKSDTFYWDACMIQATYYPPQLYEFIRNEKAAAAVGWDVDYTKNVIANAMDVLQQQGVLYDWEFYQQELKNNSLSYYDDNKICRICHVFWKEFDGRITHVIVERDTTVTGNLGIKAKGNKDSDIRFLYKNIGRYKEFGNAIHPMYFDHGNGGYHHSVTGLGVKMFSSMEYQNRLLCNLADKAFAPKIIFNPTSTESSQKFQLVHMGDWAVMPGGFQLNQTGVAGLMNDGLAMYNTVDRLQQSNLSSYRQQVPTEKQGNPVTKFEKQLEASQQSALNKTQFNRYYEQLDMLYEEIYRRLSNLNSSDSRAKEFQNRCLKRGVPKEAIGRVAKIQATRVIGQGSAFMRKQAIDSLFAIAGSLPEEGRNNLVADKIAAEAGQSAVSRYFPRKQTLPTEQEAEALQWVGLMRVGTPPVITSSQNPVVYAKTYLKACAESLASIQQGADPMEVLKFIELAGPAIAAHLQRISMDPTRQDIYKSLTQQWKALVKVTDQLRQSIAKMQEMQAQQQDKTQQALSDQELAAAKTQADIALKTEKTRAQLLQSQQKHQVKIAQQLQDMKLNDARTAADITRDNALAKADAEKPEPVAS